MPIILSGRLVNAAILVILIEEVLDDKMQCGGAAASISLNNCNLIFTFSVAASTTKSEFETPFFKSVVIVILAKVSFFAPQ